MSGFVWYLRYFSLSSLLLLPVAVTAGEMDSAQCLPESTASGTALSAQKNAQLLLASIAPDSTGLMSTPVSTYESLNEATTTQLPTSTSAPSTEVPTAEDRPIVHGVREAPSTVPKLSPTKMPRTEIANLLGWVSKPNSNLICHGYYVEPNLNYAVPNENPAQKQPPLKISADQSLLSQTDTSKLAGHVVITQPNRSIDSDLAYINRNQQTLKPESIDVYGQVILREPGNLAIANQGHFNLLDKTGTLSDVIYRMTYGNNFVDTLEYPEGKPLVNTDVNSWGIAKTVNRQADGVITIYQGTYSACPPLTRAWHLSAQDISLNHNTGRGQAYNAFFYLGDIPVLYTPYFSFPIDKRRKSGFLYPTFGHSSTSGYELGIPFYWNIAPNYDATITPDVMTERGLQMNGIFRYLTPDSSGNVHGSFLYDDKEFANFQQDSLTNYAPTMPGLSDLENASDNRYLISLQDTRSYSANWSSYLYLNHVSDDYYFEDFDSDPAQTTENQIVNQGDLYFNSEHWHFTGQMEGYQTLHPINQSYVANQYKELPELTLNGQYPAFSNGLNFNISNQFDDFYIDQDPIAGTQPEGIRVNTTPEISLPKNWVWGFFKPDLQLSATQYNLTNQLPNEASNITRVLPIFDIDAGLFFDKDTRFFGHEYKQTLEPRLFYLYVPYENQNDIPLFDTTIQPFSFSQLFQTNRFTGLDRIGDANQVSLAVTSRFIDEATGDEKLRASIGEIYYFEQRQVNLDTDTLDLVTLDNQVPANTYISPVAGELNYFINKDWNVTSNIAWDPNYGQTNNANIFFQYKTDNRHILNLGYTFLRGGDTFVPPDGTTTTIPENSIQNNLNQTDFSIVWPLAGNWTGLARWNYNISHNYPQTYFAGIQYDACCWSFRAVAGREFNYLDNMDTPQFNNEVYFQISLKTLGNVGTSSPTGLLANIPGYVDTFGLI
ncbi:MAG: LPS-assembly protein LptD [Legionellales bacterium]|nr:LPS-assembly protein LptD [Legionellales bacterium]